MSRAVPTDTAHLSDAAFLASVEACTLPNECFRHRDHLRLAWLVLRDAGAAGEAAATARMAALLRAFALHHGGSLAKFHETLTHAYMRCVAAHIAATPEIADFAGFIALHPALLDRRLPFAYYSEERLMSAAARASRVEPDLRPLPGAWR